MNRWIALLSVLLLVVGCAQATEQIDNANSPPAPLESAPVEKSVAPEISDIVEALKMPALQRPGTEEGEAAPPMTLDEPLRTAAANNNAFALELLGILRADSPGQNVLYSPFSVYTAFAMLYAGASNETAAQLAEVLHFDLSTENLHASLRDLEALLSASGGEGFTLNIANALWGQDGLSPTPAYLDTIARFYGGALHTLDFVGDAPGAADAVNRWVSEATNGKIPAIVNGFDPDTALVLANAIYFNARWAKPFDTQLTREAEFHALDGAVNPVDMMSVTEQFAYVQGDAYQMIALPYAGGTARMVVILPAEGEFTAFEQGLTATQVDQMLAQLDRSEARVALQLPRFDYETTTDLRDTLGKLGLTLPFSDAADFAGIGGEGGLKVDQAIHKARITVDEAGTEAAAATVISVVTLSAPLETEPVTMTVDRPFLYFIQDTQSGALLFVGRIVTLN